MVTALSMNKRAPAAGVLGDVLRAAAQHPRHAAVIDNGRAMSYAELVSRVQMTATQLGPRCGRVAVSTTRSSETVVALLGVLAAGGVYCPIDPTHPPERQHQLLRLAGCNILLQTRPGGPVQPLPAGIRVLPVPHRGRCAQTILPDDGVADAAAPAYLLFTSGSTGEPKGVLNSHGALTQAVSSLRRLLRLHDSDRVLQFAALNWDTCFEEIFPTLSTGAALVFDEDAHIGSHARFLRMLRACQISLLNLPTAYWHELVYYLRDTGEALPHDLRTVVIGGEPASCARIAEWCAMDTARIRLVNTYGSTETSLVTHAAELHGPDAEAPSLPWTEATQAPIGRPLAHVIERLADGGELWIGGPSLAIGYLDRPDLTAERFVVHDAGDGVRRYYRTGDRMRRTHGGALEYVGRLDRQIKVRGILVQPAEIEAEILKHPRVAVAAVVGVQKSGRCMVVAYVVPHQSGDRETLGASLLLELRRRLPSHLVPAEIRVVSALVCTASGKVDRAGSHRAFAAQFEPMVTA